MNEATGRTGKDLEDWEITKSLRNLGKDLRGNCSELKGIG